MDWGELFRLTVNPVELIVRGTATYWFIFLLFRVVLRRSVGAIGIADVLLLVLIADAAQNAMAGDYKSITDGAILVSTILGWNVLFDWVSFRFPRIGKLVEPSPLPLVEHGRMNRRNMREELVSEDELMAKLREQGIERLEEVKRAMMESDGVVTVIRYDGRNREQAARKQPV
ncbi:MAG TPA: YetF domain-containing protein [Burkholderiaceae bacterium]|nr:YetF domain-containing protein [Burkholderiaceae bacterium]